MVGLHKISADIANKMQMELTATPETNPPA